MSNCYLILSYLTTENYAVDKFFEKYCFIKIQMLSEFLLNNYNNEITFEEEIYIKGNLKNGYES